MNKITLSGNTGHSAVSRPVEKGGMVTFSLAVSDRRKNEQGEWETIRTDWFDCVVFTSTAEGASKLGAAITSGTRMIVTGEMQSRQYEKDGIKRTAWSVRVDELEIISARREEQAAAPEAQPEAAPAPLPAQDAKPAKQSDLPF